MANPIPNDDSYPATANQILRVGQGEFVGLARVTRLGMESRAGAVSSTPVPFAGAGVVARGTALSVPASLSVASITPTALTTLTFNPAITGTGLPVTFGHAFPAGAVQSGASIEVFGRTTQCDVKATHADGSVRHAILTALLDVTANVAQVAQLRTRAPVGGAPITKAHVLASAFSASVSLNVGGTLYTLSARDLLDGTVTPLQNLTHLSGPQCSEFIVGGPVRNGTTPHAHLAAYFHVRAYGSPGNVTRVRCDVVVENGWTFVAGSNVFTYAATVVVGGVTIYTNANLAHYHHTRWHHLGWWGGDPQVRATPNATYLRGTKMVPNYDPNITPNTTLLNSYTQTIVPMANANLRTVWNPGGGHPQIALMPEWYASYVMSGGDVRAYNGVLANDSAGGSFSYHYRDENTGAPVSIDTYPNACEQDPDSMVLGAGGNPLAHDAEHQPLIGYLAYLLTGDFFYLEELHFIANWGMLWRPAWHRGYAAGIIGGNTPTGNREIAWAVRSQLAAGVITPDAMTTLKNYFTGKANNNLNDIATSWAITPPNTLGVRVDIGYNDAGYYAGWQMDYLISVLNFAVEVGYTSSNAVTLRNWVDKWPAGRMGQGGNGFCPTYAAHYNWGNDANDRGVITTYPGGTYRTFAQLYQYKFPVESASPCPSSGPMFAGANVTDIHGYYSAMQPALAMAVDAGVANRNSWNKFVSLGGPDYTTGPAYAIVPREEIPAWYSSLANYQAMQFSGSNMQAVDPCPLRTCSYSGIDGQFAVMNSWGGGVFDTNRDRLIVWGGGHNDYGGNEIYAFSLLTLTWTRVTEPSDPAEKNPPLGGTRYSDGRPSSRHTAGALCYSAQEDALFSTACGASYGSSPIQNLDVDSFHFTTGTWKTNWPKTPGSDTNDVGNGTLCCYHPITGEIWAHPNSLRPLSKLVPSANGGNGAWTQYADSDMILLPTGMLDWTRNRLFAIGSQTGFQFLMWNLNTPNAAPVTVSTTGDDGGVMSSRGAGFVYDPVGDRYIGWNGGNILRILNPVTFVWTSITMSGFVPGGQAYGGTYGRFFYSPRLRGVGCVSSHTENVWFCKLP